MYGGPTIGGKIDGRPYVTAGSGPPGAVTDLDFDPAHMRHLGRIDGQTLEFVAAKR
jgi:hypothetical protein